MTLIRQFPRLLTTLVIVAAIFFAATSASVFAQSAAPTSRGDLAPIVQLIREGETKDALKALKTAVKNNEADGEAWYYLGIVISSSAISRKRRVPFARRSRSNRTLRPLRTRD